MNKIILPLLLILVTSVKSQDTITVTETNYKLGLLEEHDMYFAFYEGDKIIFNLTSDKEIKEVEIIEYPSTSRFQEYKTNLIKNKTFTITKDCFYQFRFKNGSGGRIVKFKIQRLPKDPSKNNLSTKVELKTFHDTTWIDKARKVIDHYDTIPELVLDKAGEVVHTSLNSHGAYSNVEFILPKYTSYWTYWIGIGDESVKSFKVAEQTLISKSLKFFGLSNPLAALAAGGVSYLINASAIDNISYYFHYYPIQNSPSKVFHNGGDIKNSVYGVIYPKQLGVPSTGYMYINLYNDNSFDPVSVNIKIMAIKIIPVEKEEAYREFKVKAYEKPVVVD